MSVLISVTWTLRSYEPYLWHYDENSAYMVTYSVIKPQTYFTITKKIVLYFGQSSIAYVFMDSFVIHK